MKILQKSILSLFSITLLTGCGTGEEAVKNSKTLQPHKIDRQVVNMIIKEENKAYLAAINTDKIIQFTLDANPYDSSIYEHRQVFIDLDKSGSSGYNVYEKEGIGAEYLMEDNHIFKYTGKGGFDWSWEFISDVVGSTGNSAYVGIDFFGKDIHTFDIQGVVLDEKWDGRFCSEVKRFTKIVNTQENKTSFSSFSIASDSLNYYFQNRHTEEEKHIQYFVNSDSNISTGYKDGYDYLVEDGVLFKYIGIDNKSWDWKIVDRISYYVWGLFADSIVPKEYTQSWNSSIKVKVVTFDESWENEIKTDFGTYDLDSKDIDKETLSKKLKQINDSFWKITKIVQEDGTVFVSWYSSENDNDTIVPHISYFSYVDTVLTYQKDIYRIEDFVLWGESFEELIKVDKVDEKYRLTIKYHNDFGDNLKTIVFDSTSGEIDILGRNFISTESYDLFFNTDENEDTIFTVINKENKEQSKQTISGLNLEVFPYGYERSIEVKYDEVDKKVKYTLLRGFDNKTTLREVEFDLSDVKNITVISDK